MYKATNDPKVFIRLADKAAVHVDRDGDDGDNLRVFLTTNTPEPADPIPGPTLEDRLRESDYYMARIGEDLIDALVTNMGFNITWLPATARAKLTQRKQIRQEMAPK